MADRKLRISVLDQSPIRRGSNAVEALQESIKLAQMADRLGLPATGFLNIIIPALWRAHLLKY
ncbi:hypothetical protein [Chitinophaga pinensis]|uniref:hypothetical protein n=1 Tax=Chitinophaga pinensis TaxID=79329 RepID=UPI0021BDE36A|nr:hypothetical protein [Chitinophaga pinensis]